MWRRLVSTVLFLMPATRAKWQAFLIALLATLFFWFFLGLSKEYSTALNYPLLLTYDSTQELIVRRAPSKVRMEVRGTGWNLLSHNLGWQVDPIEVHLEQPVRMAVLTSNEVRAAAQDQMDKLRLEYIYDDSLMLDLQPKISRLLPVYADATCLLLAEGYHLKGSVTLDTDSVKVSGPADVINQLPDSLALRYPDRNLTEPLDEQLPLVDVEELAFVQAEPPTVGISANVQPLRGLVLPVRLVAEDSAATTTLNAQNPRVNWLLYADDADDKAFLRQLDTLKVRLGPVDNGRRHVQPENVPPAVYSWELQPDSLYVDEP